MSPDISTPEIQPMQSIKTQRVSRTLPTRILHRSVVQRALSTRDFLTFFPTHLLVFFFIGMNSCQDSAHRAIGCHSSIAPSALSLVCPASDLRCCGYGFARFDIDICISSSDSKYPFALRDCLCSSSGVRAAPGDSSRSRIVMRRVQPILSSRDDSGEHSDRAPVHHCNLSIAHLMHHSFDGHQTHIGDRLACSTRSTPACASKIV